MLVFFSPPNSSYTGYRDTSSQDLLHFVVGFEQIVAGFERNDPFAGSQAVSVGVGHLAVATGFVFEVGPGYAGGKVFADEREFSAFDAFSARGVASAVVIGML